MKLDLRVGVAPPLTRELKASEIQLHSPTADCGVAWDKRSRLTRAPVKPLGVRLPTEAKKASATQLPLSGWKSRSKSAGPCPGIHEGSSSMETKLFLKGMSVISWTSMPKASSTQLHSSGFGDMGRGAGDGDRATHTSATAPRTPPFSRRSVATISSSSRLAENISEISVSRPSPGGGANVGRKAATGSATSGAGSGASAGSEAGTGSGVGASAGSGSACFGRQRIGTNSLAKGLRPGCATLAAEAATGTKSGASAFKSEAGTGAAPPRVRLRCCGTGGSCTSSLPPSSVRSSAKSRRKPPWRTMGRYLLSRLRKTARLEKWATLRLRPWRCAGETSAILSLGCL
mmetsp:Transcript_15647/g.33287  ORF Transcript_15647/g.33287 Transcript_15647/m.33287 type:complete len:345 (+) Transcript_15647:487-1521(+)